MVPEGIQGEDLCKIRSNSENKKTSGVDRRCKQAERNLWNQEYRNNFDHQILTEDGILFPQALYNDLVFGPTVPPTSQVVKGSDPTRMKYKLINIQLEPV